MRPSRERVEEIKKTRENVYLRAKTLNIIPISAKIVSELFKIYDEEFFNGQISQKVTELSLKASRKYSVSPEIQFLAIRRTSGYGSLSGYYFEKIYDKLTGSYSYQKVFFLDICPNLLETIFRVTKGKGLPYAAGIGCDEEIRCLMLVMEHEIIHLLMNLWDYDSLKRREKNFLLFGPHGRLFNCMLETYFGHTQRNHNLSLEGVYVPSYALPSSTPKEVGAGFSNWSASCYLDAVIMVMLETQSNFWRSSIFDWSLEKDARGASAKSTNADLSKQVQDALLEDYRVVHDPQAEPVECVNLRELLSIQDPLMKTSEGSWKMYESGSTYATFVQLFPNLLIDVPVRMIRPDLGEEESLRYEYDAAFTFSDFMIGPTPEENEDYKVILWEELQSPALVFTHQGAPPIKIFDSLEDEDQLEYEKIRAFGPKIINEKYKLAGVVVLHGRVTKKGGGGHYTCYFLAKDSQWYHYDDMEPSFELIGSVEDLPRNGVWQQSSGKMPTMYFYVLDEGLKGLREVKSPSKAQKEEKQAVRHKDFDYARVDRPDGGVIFVVEFKNPTTKLRLLKTLRALPEVTETKISENKFAWRVSGADAGAGEIQKILLKEASSSAPDTTPVPKVYKGMKGRKYTVYDYSDKTVAVVGSKISGLEEIGLETKSLKFGLGHGFIVSKKNIKKLEELLE